MAWPVGVIRVKSGGVLCNDLLSPSAWLWRNAVAAGILVALVPPVPASHSLGKIIRKDGQ